MTPYLEGLSLSLIVSDWDSDDQLELVSAIGSVQYSYFDASDPTFDAIVREPTPNERRNLPRGGLTPLPEIGLGCH
jgi:hypothetical protein